MPSRAPAILKAIATYAMMGGWFVSLIFGYAATPILFRNATLVGYVWPSWWAVGTRLSLALMLGISLAWLKRRNSPLFPKTIFPAWQWGVRWLMCASVLPLFSPAETLGTCLTQILISLLFLLSLRHRLVGRSPTIVWDREIGFLLFFAPVLLYPWLAWHSLGSPLDIVLNLTAALLFGLAGGVVAEDFILSPLATPSKEGSSTELSDGIALTGLFCILGAAYGIQEISLFLLLLLPSLGWLIIALRHQTHSQGGGWLKAALLLGLGATAPMMWVDPEETLLLVNLGEQDILAWTLYATIASLLIIGVAIIVVVSRRKFPATSFPALPWPAAGVITWLGALVIYWFVGQPGFHGDRLFVILKEQAVLPPNTIAGSGSERAAFVHRVLTTQANHSQAPLRSALERLEVPYRPYYLINALEVSGGPLHRLWLASRPEVDRVLHSPVLRPLPVLPSIQRGEAPVPKQPPWNLAQIGADRVWQEWGVRGEGIAVGLLDSGVQEEHPALKDSYRGSGSGALVSWHDPWYQSSHPQDFRGHGTHVAGIMVGNGIGVAPDAEWVACASLVRPLGNPALYLECLQFMLAPFPNGGDSFRDGDPAQGVQVLNNSWLCPPIEGCDPSSLLPATRALRAAGIFIVAAAGNTGFGGCGTVTDPLALYEEVLTVGATDNKGYPASFSSRGPVKVDGGRRDKPDLVAPGVDILSSYPGGSYEFASGTSMAGPHIAGVVALMWSAAPELIGDIATTEQILARTAQPLASSAMECEGPTNIVGAGQVDAYQAVQGALMMRKEK